MRVVAVQRVRMSAPAPARAGTGTVVMRLLLALACLAVPVWVVATRWSTLLADHPAYPVALVIVAVLGAVLAVRARRARTGGPLRIAAHVVGAVAVVAVLAALVWLRPFPADPVAVAATGPSPGVDVVSTATTWELRPRDGPGVTGVLYHPGARVDSRAYLPLLRPLAEQGHLVVVAKAPLGIALLSTGVATGVFDAHPEVPRWVLGGHSLGGTAAAFSADDGDPRVRGVFFWASYPASDLSASGLTFASISGERDGLATPADIEASRLLLPPATAFTVVPGAVHAFFGDYGAQPGDGRPTVGRAEAQRQIVAATAVFVGGVG